jgi:branched-chain amino acid transport system permease protein
VDGGVSSLLGAVVGAITISLFNILLDNASGLGIHVFGLKITAPSGTSLVGIAVVMLAILLLRPAGITGGKEFSAPWTALRRRLSSG